MSQNQLPQLEVKVDGVTHYKTVGYTQLLRLLDHSMTVKQLELTDVRHNRIPMVPDRTLFMESYESPSWHDYVITGWVPRLEYPFLFMNQSYPINVPTMVYQMRYRANEKRVTSFRLAVTTDEIVTAESQLYRWPFSNVLRQEAVCWTAKNFQSELNEVVEKGVFGFLGTPNNSDGFGIGKSHNSEYTNLEDFLSAVAERGEVPIEWLLPLNKTVEEFHEQH